MDKTERLINLIALLLNTRRPLSADEIRTKNPGYGAENDETFHRMFERDKDELRDLGFSVVAEDTDGWGTQGYRISAEDALLEDPGLAPDEWAALSLAAQAWGDPGGGDGVLGLLKLAVVQGAEPGAAGWLVARVGIDRTVRTLMDAVARRKRVGFRYRTGGGSEAQERRLDPYRLSHRGSWYVTGLDHDRGEVRSFKLARIEGAVKLAAGKGPDFDPPPPGDRGVRRGPWEGEAAGTARIAFAPEAAWWAERRTGARRVAERDDAWVVSEVPVADLEQFASWVAGFGSRARVEDPPELRDAVVARLRAVAEAT